MPNCHCDGRKSCTVEFIALLLEEICSRKSNENIKLETPGWTNHKKKYSRSLFSRLLTDLPDRKQRKSVPHKRVMAKRVLNSLKIKWKSTKLPPEFMIFRLTHFSNLESEFWSKSAPIRWFLWVQTPNSYHNRQIKGATNLNSVTLRYVESIIKHKRSKVPINLNVESVLCFNVYKRQK